jgi:putative chitinase
MTAQKAPAFHYLTIQLSIYLTRHLGARMINRNFFFDYVRAHLFNGSLKQTQVTGLTAVLDHWESDYASKDDRWLAYALGTAHHETDRTFKGIEEYGKGRGKPYGEPDPQTGKAYYGRGLVQLTWKTNYKKMGDIIGVDLVKNPEKALDIDIAAKVLLIGMMRGIFTGKKLSDYFSPSKEDWVNARRIVNGLDKANLIAGYAKQYYAAISHTT